MVERRTLEFQQSCYRLAQREAIGEERDPQTEEEADRFANKIAWVRRQCGIFDYQPHLKQQIMHLARCKVKYFQGSNQSGKTTCSIVEALDWALGVRLWCGEPVIHPLTGKVVDPSNLLIAYCLDDFLNKGMEVLVPKIKELVPWDAVVLKKHTIQGGAVHKIDFKTGASIKLLSYEQMPHKHEGYTWDLVLFDEPPPRWSYVACWRGTMKRHAPLMFALTAISQPWIQEQIVESPATVNCESIEDLKQLKPHSTCMVQVGFPEITHLSEDEKEAFASQLTDEEKAARVYGQALHMQGRVFSSYTDKRRQLDDDDLENIAQACGIPWRKWPWGQIVDPHDRRPYAVMWFVITPRNEMVIVREWPEFDYYSVKNSENRVDDYVEIFQEIENGMFETPCSWRRMDPRFGRTPKATSNTTLQEEFAFRGFDYDTLFTDDQRLEPGHHKIAKRLADDALYVHESCDNVHRAFLHYVRQDHARDDGSKPAKEGAMSVKERHKDFIDLVRYALEDEPEWFDPVEIRADQWSVPQGYGLGRRF